MSLLCPVMCAFVQKSMESPFCLNLINLLNPSSLFIVIFGVNRVLPPFRRNNCL